MIPLRDVIPSRTTPYITVTIIVLNAIAWLYEVSLPSDVLEVFTRVYGVVPKMSLTPGRIWRGAPSIGDDTTDILATLLNLSEPEIEKLYDDEVVHRTEPFTEPQVDAVNP